MYKCTTAISRMGLFHQIPHFGMTRAEISFTLTPQIKKTDMQRQTHTNRNRRKAETHARNCKIQTRDRQTDTHTGTWADTHQSTHTHKHRDTHIKTYRGNPFQIIATKTAKPKKHDAHRHAIQHNSKARNAAL